MGFNSGFKGLINTSVQKFCASGLQVKKIMNVLTKVAPAVFLRGDIYVIFILKKKKDYGRV